MGADCILLGRMETKPWGPLCPLLYHFYSRIKTWAPHCADRPLSPQIMWRRKRLACQATETSTSIKGSCFALPRDTLPLQAGPCSASTVAGVASLSPGMLLVVPNSLQGQGVWDLGFKQSTRSSWSFTFYFLPSTMIMWYPNLVLTGGSVYTGLSMLLTGRANAASWNGPTMEPLVIQPRSPCSKGPLGVKL